MSERQTSSSPHPLQTLVSEILDTHHKFLHEELPRLSAVFVDFPEALCGPWKELAELMKERMAREQQHLFPTIIKLAEGHDLETGPGEAEGPFTELGLQHPRIDLLLEQLTAAVALAGPYQEALVFVLADLAECLAKEDKHLIPATRALVRGQGMRTQLTRLESEHTALSTGFRLLGESLEKDAAPAALLTRFKVFHERLQEHMVEEFNQLVPALRALAMGYAPPDDGFESLLANLHTETSEIAAFGEAVHRVLDLAGEHEDRLLDLLSQLEAHSRWEEEELFPEAMNLLEAWQPLVLATSDPGTQGNARHPWVLRTTHATCPVCLTDLPADVVVHADRVCLERTCPDHGHTAQLLSRSPAYWVVPGPLLLSGQPGVLGPARLHRSHDRTVQHELPDLPGASQRLRRGGPGPACSGRPSWQTAPKDASRST